MSVKTNQRILLAIAFLSGMSVMAMEISASRLIAPYFGTSLFVWTNVIGVVLIALSIGYYVGGKFSDKHPKLKNLLWLLCVAGLLFSIVPWVAEPIAEGIKSALFNYQSASALIMIGSFLLILLLFAFPLLILGMVSPFVIKLYANSIEHLGESTGAVFAVSTIGSILGTFLPTLWLIPAIGTRFTILSFALLLVLVSAIGLYRDKRYVIIAIVVIAMFVLNPVLQPAHAASLYETESPYQYINVLDNGRQRALVFNEGLVAQSVYDPNDLFLGMYYDYFATLPALFPDKQVTVGIIGLAGGTISRSLHAVYGDRVFVDGVEIDQKVIDIAKKYFELEQPSLTVYNEDGKMFIQRQKDKYDVLVIDAYAQQLYIPWTMTTQEFWQDSKEAMKRGGVLALNINTSSVESRLFQSVSNTIASVFEYTYVVPIDREGIYNHIILASESEIPFDALFEKELPDPLNYLSAYIISKQTPIAYDPQIDVLTNDWAPIELMTEKLILQKYLESK